MTTMRSTILWIAIAAASLQARGAETRTVALIPRPVKMEVLPGEFVLAPGTTILVSRDARTEGEYLAQLLRAATGLRLEVKPLPQQKEHANCVVLRTVSGRKDLGAEGYALKVLNDRVLVDAPAACGVFYACQTLRQLLPAAIEARAEVRGVKWAVPRVQIEDRPRLPWRGLMLDTARCYYSMDWLKRYIDLLAYYKMNRFHWHLTERVGWRIEIKRYPQLTRHGIHTTDPDKKPLPPGRTVREYYTQEEVRRIVAYAQSRHVMVIPEIEMPGHSGAAVGTYPDKMRCVADRWSRRSGGLVGRIMCAGNEGTFEFIEGVLSEVAELFPAPWIHIGGDEPHTRVWAECTRCRQRMKAEGLNGAGELYNYFMKRVEKIVASKGKRMYGWEEIGRAGLSKGATIQSWHGTGPGLAAANRGQDVVMSPASHCYLDASNGRTPVSRCYSFEPVPADLAPDKARHVLGLEAPMWMDQWRNWAQYRPRTGTLARVDSQLFPRLIALAEVGWSPKEARDWADFRARLASHGERLRRMGVSYYRDRSVWDK